MGLEGEDWIHVTEDRGRWRVVVDAVTTLLLTYRAVNVYIICGTVTIPSR
jgi:hypothetical protein